MVMVCHRRTSRSCKASNQNRTITGSMLRGGAEGTGCGAEETEQRKRGTEQIKCTLRPPYPPLKVGGGGGGRVRKVLPYGPRPLKSTGRHGVF